MEENYLYSLNAIRDNHDFYASWINHVFCRIEGPSSIQCSSHCHRSLEIWYPFSSKGIVEINGHVIEANEGDGYGSFLAAACCGIHAEKLHGH